MECCGARRLGNFCSECGKPIRGHGLISLRNYCAAMLAVNKANYERAVSRGNRIGKMLTTMEKWQRWLAALDAVINDTSGGGTATTEAKYEATPKEPHRTDAAGQ